MMSGAASPPPARPSPPASLTAVRGLSVGHWTDLARATGCTVVLAPEGGMRAACAVRGRATGTRELDALHPRHLVGHVDAILLTGGAAPRPGAPHSPVRRPPRPGPDLARATGCTVVLAPEGGMRAACAVRGRATGTRELDALHPRHLVGHVDAILLTGGSAYGLGAANGVMRWLRERGRGFPVGPAGVVPI